MSHSFQSFAIFSGGVGDGDFDKESDIGVESHSIQVTATTSDFCDDGDETVSMHPEVPAWRSLHTVETRPAEQARSSSDSGTFTQQSSVAPGSSRYKFIQRRHDGAVKFKVFEVDGPGLSPARSSRSEASGSSGRSHTWGGDPRWVLARGEDERGRDREEPISYGRFMHLLEVDDELREKFIEVLKIGTPFEAYFFETPCVTPSNAECKPFEFVLVPAPTLRGVRSDAETFREHFRRDSQVVSFTNRSRDATLVSPCPSRSYNTGVNDHCAHLASFVRVGHPRQVNALWKKVGRTVLDELRTIPSTEQLWLSTAGFGVSWLHVRLDETPKYYSFREYRRQAEGRVKQWTDFP